MQEIRQSIEEYMCERIKTWWNEYIMATCTDESPHPHQRPPFAKGFQAFQASRKYKEKIVSLDSRLIYFKAGQLKRFLGIKTKTNIADYIITLPLEKQLELLGKLYPTNHKHFLEIIPMGINANIMQLNFHKVLETSDSALSFLNLIMDLLYRHPLELLNEFRFKGSKPLGTRRILEFLSFLNTKKWVLLHPAKLASMNCQEGSSTHISQTLSHPSYYSNERHALAQSILEETRRASTAGAAYWKKTAYLRICSLLCATDITALGDFSTDLLEFYISMPKHTTTQTSISVANTANKQISAAIARLFQKDERYSSKVFRLAKQLTSPKDKQKEISRSRGFRWALEKRPEFEDWVEALEEYLHQKLSQRAETIVWYLNHWLDYLIGIEQPPLYLKDVNRATHIFNPFNPNVETFFNYVDKLKIGFREKNKCMHTLADLYNYYHDKFLAIYEGPLEQAPVLPNPVQSTDRWHVNQRRKTHRFALGTELLKRIREVLLDRDGEGLPTFKWAQTCSKSRGDWITVVDPNTKKTVQEWWPGRAIALYVLLEIPIRGIQARWLDEGAGDEYVYDFIKQEMVLNSHPLAEPGRAEGIFRLMRDPFHGSSFVAIYVNTNKTRQYDWKSARGYEIPWPNNEFFNVIRIMLDWNRKYSRYPQPVTFADDNSHFVTEATKPNLPKFFPLFRDPKTIGHRSSDLPIHASKINELWSNLLAETERLLKEEGKDAHLVDWVMDTRRGTERLIPRAKFDLHTLRVSGITSLLELGIPVHIISEFVAGHATIIMTLHYDKTNPAKVREMLRQAQDKAQDDLDKCLSLLDEMDDPSSIVVWNNFDFPGDDAREAMKMNKGLWKVDLTGICPGTLCEEGGPYDSTNKIGTPIPTGACGLCRYYITGPAFIFGQMQKINNLMYLMREKGQELKELRLRVIDLEEGIDKRSLAEASGRLDRIDRELKDITHEWFNRYRLFQASIGLLDKYEMKKAHKPSKNSKETSSQLPMPLLSATDAEGFTPIVKEARNVGLVRQISLMHEILGGFDLHKGPIKEYEEILNTILLKNNFEALLLTIPREKRTAAANMLGEFLISSLGEEEVEKLYEGESLLPPEMKVETETLLEFIKSGTFTTSALDQPPVQPRMQLVQIERRKEQAETLSPHRQPRQLKAKA
jgi:hypothetical protein